MTYFDSGPDPRDDEETLWLGRQSGRRRPVRGGRGAIVTVAVLVAGLAVGFVVGHHGTSTPSATATVRVTVARGSPVATDATDALAATGRTCARETGRQLSLGFELTNGSGAALTVRLVQAMTPLGGLREEHTRVGVCTQLGTLPGPAGYRVDAGATVWLVTTLAVLRRCPVADPVQFRVDYSYLGHEVTALYPSFPDLGSVPLTGCAGS